MVASLFHLTIAVGQDTLTCRPGYFDMIWRCHGFVSLLNLMPARNAVEKAAEARENDQERKLKQADRQRQKDMVELAVLCDRMDNDGSGALSLHEMLDGFDYDLDFQRVMARMDIERSEMETLLKALDADASGELDFLEFCYHLGSCKRRDPLMLSALTRYGVMEVKTLIHSEVSKALEEQRQMLQDQLELFSHIPSCEHAAKELRQKRLEKARDAGSDSGGQHGKHVGNSESTKPVPKQHARRTQHQHQVMQVSQVTLDAVEVDSRYDELQREEEALHAKCRSLIDSIALSLGEPHVARDHVRV
eukprot:s520_g5.t1